jgi:hypothetical protein
MAEGLVSRHVSADGTLVRANASYKSFVPIEVALAPEEYKRRLRAEDRHEPDGPEDPCNRKNPLSAPRVRGRKPQHARAFASSARHPDLTIKRPFGSHFVSVLLGGSPPAA